MSDSTLTRAHRIDRIDWLGKEEIPSTWSAVKLGMLARFKSGDAINGDLISPTGDYPVYGGGGLRGYTDAFNTEGYCPMIGRQGALCGKVWTGKGKFYATEHAIVAHPGSDCHPQWLRYTLSVMDLGQYSTSAAQPGISVDTVTSKRVPHPPLALQRAIADFLDRETAQIDAFIAKNEELITLLIERRQAVIAHLITKGLEGTKLRPSGIDWAGDVPDSWQVGNIRRFAAMRTGHTPSRQHPEYWVDCTIPWFTLADVWQLRQGRRMMSETSESISVLGLANSAAELLPAGTVALSRTASVGFAGIIPVPMATSQDFWNWIPGPQILSEFLWYQFLAMKTEFGRLMMGSTHRTIYQADAASLQLIVPPIAEQAEIVAQLDEQTRRLDAGLDAARRAIDLARERRAALISAAVTGKIDVGVSA